MNYLFSPIQLNIQEGFDYKIFKAPQKWSEDLHYIWKLKSKDFSGIKPYYIIPDGCSDILLEKVDKQFTNPTISKSFSKISTIFLPGNFEIWGIRFKQGKIRKYFDIEISELTSDFSDIDFGDEFFSIDSFLLELEKKSVQKNFNNILKKWDNNFVRMLNSSISERQKRRIFKRSTGFSMKEYKNIWRFQSVIKNPQEYLDYFYDQSDLIDHFKRITNLTPKQFFKNFKILSTSYN